MQREKTYQERKQPKSRLKYGKLEKKKDLKKRLVKINKYKEEVHKAKEQIQGMSGQEYFFGYHSVHMDGNKAYKTLDPTIDELRRMKAYIDNEIQRCEKKIEMYIPKHVGTRISLDEDSESSSSDPQCVFGRNEEIRDELKKYVGELASKREEVMGKINALSNLKNR
ncbi:hypothetical protein CWI40_021660 [Ordospora colligata]|nr:hypothetical protein CWI40_021660 [Ordospora colligata]